MAETPRLTNQQLADVMRDIATRLEIKGESAFKSRAYRRAAEAIEGLGHDIRREWEAGTLEEISGIGAAISGKLDELLRTGRLAYLEKLRKEVPDSLVTLTQVPEVGPKTARAIHAELGISTLEALEEAARQGRLREVSGIGAKTEAGILAGIASLRQRAKEPSRALLGVVWPRAQALLAELYDDAGAAIVHAEVGGSLRRRRATIGDIDLLIASARPADVTAAFRTLEQTAEVLLSGETKTSV
ncbi:MAG TPA: helix-hairpin-helix domain-containing protein, partial [Ardenticatenaceae bacterium]|nr:helix-hairpin-helix domain-containing protein [Ardenticatenaceae bacterium]